MSKNELIAKIEALNEWEAVIEEAKAEAEAIRDSIKQEMLERETEELTAGQYIVRYICPCCGNSVRATKIVNIACLDCAEQMVLAG